MSTHARHGESGTPDRPRERQGDANASGLPGNKRDEADASSAAPQAPRGGMNPEVGDLDAEADPDRQDPDDDDSLPGRMGGGMIGG